MAGVPQKLDDWNLDSVTELVDRGYFETDSFDFKAVLHAANNSSEYGRRLARTACAFANTRGGFLVFGVKDAQTGLSTENRIVGIDNSSELAKHFGDQVSTAEPGLIFNPLNPSIPLPGTTKVIYVVHVPPRLRGPHIIGDGIFYKRTNSGNEKMSYAEIETSFVNYEERLAKVKLLYMTLIDLWNRAALAGESSENTPSYSLMTFDTTAFIPILSNIYGLVTPIEVIADGLLEIKMVADLLNTKIGLFHQSRILPMSGVSERTRRHNDGVLESLDTLQHKIDRTLISLEKHFEFQRETIAERNIKLLRVVSVNNKHTDG